MSGDLICYVFEKQIKSQKKLSVHSWATHSDENLPCSSCDKTLRTKKHLANHVTNKHTEKKPVQCDFKTNDKACSYYSTSKGNLKAHKKRVHKKLTVIIIVLLCFLSCVPSNDYKKIKQITMIAFI